MSKRSAIIMRKLTLFVTLIRMEKRLYRVPEPMWPKQEEKVDRKRLLEVIFATDFTSFSEETCCSL